MRRILLTGASGLLGRELRKLRAFDFAPSREELDISSTLSVFSYFYKLHLTSHCPDLIVNCAAYTQVEQAEVDKKAAYETNVTGVHNLLDLEIPMLHISTAYVFDGEKGNYKEDDYLNPQGYYALTKALGEQAVLGSGKSVVLRTLFKPSPWRYERAYTDQITTGMYVEEAARKVNQAIERFADLPPVAIHMGGRRQPIFDLARETRNVLPMSIEDVKADIPADCSLNCDRWNEFIGDK